MRTCGATPGGPELAGIDLAKQAVIQGVVLRDGSSDSVPNGIPATTGYVRLLDRDGEFVAEVPLNEHGQFRFFAAPGNWTVRALVPGATSQVEVSAEYGRALELTISL
ncbi:MAG: DUF1416 domain-containing protein [Actinobacteria bacterium]|nr:DUF1416 domain-containing protein [Actinomycetota bacterium]